MKRTILALLMAPGLAGCDIRIDGTPALLGSGNNASEKRQTGEFTGVVLESSANVDVKIGGATTVVVQGDDNLLPIITTEVKDGRLVIGSREPYTTRLGIQVYVITPKLEAVILDGSGSIRTRKVKADRFEAVVPGSGEIQIHGLTADRVLAEVEGSGDLKIRDLYAQTLTGVIGGSGSIEISGGTNAVEGSIRGSGTLKLNRLGARDVTVNIGGSGDAEVDVLESLDAVVSGSGSVAYSGDPKSVKKSISGSGQVRAR